MGTTINTSYGQLYKGVESIVSQGTAANTKAKGNTSSQYEANAEVEFSKDGLAALAASKENTTESKLSAKAQDYLDSLRKQYGDYDFFVAGDSEERDRMLKQGDKDFSVVIDLDEIERMANDDEYAAEKIKQMESAIDLAKKVSEEFGFTEDGGENGTLTNLSITLR